MSDVRLIRADNSAAFLSEDAPFRRRPWAPKRRRPEEFYRRFEDRALVYDCFWHADGRRILLVGPPPMNLKPEIQAARYIALPSKAELTATYHGSLSTMTTALAGAPQGTREVAMSIAGEVFVLPVQPNHAAELAGRRILFTMSKDNELDWIAEWARWHARLHGTDSIVFFDNGSSKYGLGEIEEKLLGVGGIRKVSVQSWPYSYGMTDPALRMNPFYILFLQVSSMSVVLRRFAASAYGLLNADVDELVATPAGTTIFDLARQSSHGLIVMRGRYIEAVASGAGEGPRTHRHFLHSHRDPRQARSGPKKWALDPSRPWLERLSVHPYMHWIWGRPWFSKSTPPGVFYRHFRGINTNWKHERTGLRHRSDSELVQDVDFAQLVARDAF